MSEYKRVQAWLLDLLLFSLAMVPFFILFILNKYTWAEDSFIAFRYVENLAAGDGYIWNPGGNPVFGSTSFLWTILLAGLHIIIPLPLFSIVLGFSVFLVVLTGLVLFFTVRIVMGFPRIYALLPVLLLSVSSISIHAMLGFETILVSLLWLVQFSLLHQVTKESASINKWYSFLIISFVLGVARPEGMIISAAAVFVALVLRGTLRSKKRLTDIVIVWILPTAIFILFQIWYFGYPFPNAFYVKLGGTGSILTSLRKHRAFLFKDSVLIVITTIAIWFVLQTRNSFNRNVLLMVPLGVYLGAYLFINQTQNIASRFQFPIYPILLLFFSEAVYFIFHDRISEMLRNTRIALSGEKKMFKAILSNGLRLAFLLLLISSLFYFEYSLNNHLAEPKFDERKEIGLALAPFAQQGYTMAVTEAGAIPYYSSWIVLDVIGLNDEYIAHNGFDVEYLEIFNPDMIQFHAYSANFTKQWSDDDMWNETISILVAYAIVENYTLVMITDPEIMGGYEWFYLKPDLSQFNEIVTALTTLEEVEYLYSIA